VADRLRLAVMGVAHVHARSLIQQARELDEVAVVGICDPLRQQTAEALAKEFEIPRVFDSYQDLLEAARPEAVLCCAENARHVDAVEACARAGVAVMVEKPLAASYQQAVRMAELNKATGVRIMTNWPFIYHAVYHRLCEVVREGVLGQVFGFRLRAGHAGPTGGVRPADEGSGWWFSRALGGGALLDFCCYGACLCQWLLAQPAQQVMAMAERLVYDFGDTEDNAIMLVRYPKALAIFEATWTQRADPGPGGPVVWGTGGTAVLGEQGTVRLLRGGHEERLGGGELPLAPNGPAHFVECVRTGKPFHEVLALEHNVQVMAILEAGLRSAQQGRAVVPGALD
jgi:predicted dehydrogenase